MGSQLPARVLSDESLMALLPSTAQVFQGPPLKTMDPNCPFEHTSSTRAVETSSKLKEITCLSMSPAYKTALGMSGFTQRTPPCKAHLPWTPNQSIPSSTTSTTTSTACVSV